LHEAIKRCPHKAQKHALGELPRPQEHTFAEPRSSPAYSCNKRVAPTECDAESIISPSSQAVHHPRSLWYGRTSLSGCLRGRRQHLL